MSRHAYLCLCTDDLGPGRSSTRDFELATLQVVPFTVFCSIAAAYPLMVDFFPSCPRTEVRPIPRVFASALDGCEEYKSQYYERRDDE